MSERWLLGDLIAAARRDLVALEERARAEAALRELIALADRASAGEFVGPPAAGASEARLDAARAIDLGRRWIRRRHSTHGRHVQHELLVAIGTLVLHAAEPGRDRPWWEACETCGAAAGQRCQTVVGEPTAIHLHRQRGVRP